MHRRSRKMTVVFLVILILAILITSACLWKFGALLPRKYWLLAFFLGVVAISALLVFLVSRFKGSGR